LKKRARRALLTGVIRLDPGLRRAGSTTNRPTESPVQWVSVNFHFLFSDLKNFLLYQAYMT
jgi:hypothetical protein